MTDLRDLYQEVILDHNKSPHNYREMPDATRLALGNNPLCGDKLKLYVRIEGDRIADVAFQGSGCAISKASASIMTQKLVGKTLPEARQFIDSFLNMMRGAVPFGGKEMGDLKALEGVLKFPVRVKCATLAWNTAQQGIQERAIKKS